MDAGLSGSLLAGEPNINSELHQHLEWLHDLRFEVTVSIQRSIGRNQFKIGFSQKYHWSQQPTHSTVQLLLLQTNCIFVE